MHDLSFFDYTKIALRVFKWAAGFLIPTNQTRFARFLNFRALDFARPFPWLDDRKILILVAETVPESDCNDETTCQAIRATGEGQVFALFHLLPWLSRLVGETNLELQFARKRENITRNEYDRIRSKYRLVILGGPINNNWARAVHEFELPRFNFGATTANNHVDPHCLTDKCHTNVCYTPEPDCDYALIVQVPTKAGNGFDVLYLSGSTTKGTAAAAKAVATPRTLKFIAARMKSCSSKYYREGGCFYLKALGPDVLNQDVDLETGVFGALKTT
jgi:hypothetical protein